MIGRIEAFLHALRRLCSRSEWLVRALRLPRCEGTQTAPGLVLIQIDGLSREALEREMATGAMPFLRRLLEREHYRLHRHDAGSPAAGVQGELFYGVREAVPDSEARERVPGTSAWRFEALVAAPMEARLQAQGGEALLRGGSVYAGQFTGGAAETHFCATAPGLGSPLGEVGVPALVLVTLLNAYGLARAGALQALESLPALGRGSRGASPAPVSSAAPAPARHRLARGPVLRELATIGAGIDLARGLPVVHLSWACCREQTHGHGSASRLARWSLRGVDTAVGRVWRAAQRSARRHYDVWLYSGDGQAGAPTPPVLQASGFSPSPLDAVVGPGVRPGGPPGARETVGDARAPGEPGGFALLPVDAPVAAFGSGGLHPADLRAAALRFLGRRSATALPRRRRPTAAPGGTLRVMTYNVHSCVGMDGKLSPGRIARIIDRYAPDVAALQELDVGRARTGGTDQAHLIARHLDMSFVFHPSVRVEEERYGDAVLSHLPMRLVRAGPLPGLPDRPQLEPRGALWVAIDVNGTEYQLINTHLGLVARERARQVEALLGPQWLGDPRCRGPVILCGDLNARPSSPVCRSLSRHLADAQTALPLHRPRGTFYPRLLATRIDHVFVAPGLEVVDVAVPDDQLLRTASDHLPLVVEVRDARSRHAAAGGRGAGAPVR